MRKKNTIIAFIIAVLICAPLLTLLSHTPVSAAYVESKELYEKSLLLGVHSCYTGTYMRTTVYGDASLAAGGNEHYIFTSDGGKTRFLTVTGQTEKLTCQEVITRAIEVFGLPKFQPGATQGGTSLSTLGYEPDGNGGGTARTFEVTGSFDYVDAQGGSEGTIQSNNQFTLTIDSNGSLISTTGIPQCDSGNAGTGLCFKFIEGNRNNGATSARVGLHANYDPSNPLTADATITLIAEPNKSPSISFRIGNATQCDKITPSTTALYSCNAGGYRRFENFSQPSAKVTNSNQGINTDEQYTFKGGDAQKAKEVFLQKLGAPTNTPGPNDRFQGNDYLVALDSIAYAQQTGGIKGGFAVSSSDCNPTTPDSNSFYLPSDGKWCKVNDIDGVQVEDNAIFTYIDGSGNLVTKKGKEGLREALASLKTQMGKLNIDSTKPFSESVQNATNPGVTASGNPQPTQQPGQNQNNGSTPECYVAAKSLGWIICPVMQFAGVAIDSFYDAFIEEMLVIDAAPFRNGGEAFIGWSYFRNFANIFFAIALAFVIIAQISGIGLSNYNIKKILPQLIVVAVLVNLSYIICQLAVDVSNILGSQLYKFFNETLAVPAATGSFFEKLGGSITLSGFVLTILGILGILGTASIVVSNVAVWLPFLVLAIIGALISVLFTFILFGVYQAGTILLVVISPLAMVCYALPNTKSLFNKWKNAFTGLILVYPLCGAMMGGSHFAAKLLVNVDASEGNFWKVLVAMLLCIVPVFFIPTILRAQMRALGNIGGRLQAAGRRLGGLARGAVSHSDRFKDFQRTMGIQRDRRIANRYAGRTGAFHKRARANAVNRLTKAYGEDLTAEALANQEVPYVNERTGESNHAYDALRSGIFNKQRTAAIKDEETFIKSGDLDSLAPGGGKIDATDFERGGSLDRDYRATLRLLQDENLDSTTRETYKKHLAAMQNTLAGNSKGQLLILDAYHDLLTESDHRNGNKDDVLYLSANQLMTSGNAASLKNDNRFLFSVISSLNQAEYHSGTAGTEGRMARTYDPNGNLSSDEFLEKYALAGSKDYTSRTIGNVDENVLHYVGDALRLGYGTEEQRADWFKLANDTFADERVKNKPKVAAELEQIALTGAAAGADQIRPDMVDSDGKRPYNAFNNHSAGSLYMTDTSPETLKAIDKKIGTMKRVDGNPNKLELAADEALVRSAAENARRALKNPDASFNKATADGLNKIISDAKALGIKDQAGNDFETIDALNLKITDHAKVSAAERAAEYEKAYRSGQIKLQVSNSALDLNTHTGIRALTGEYHSLLEKLEKAPNDVSLRGRVEGLQNIMVKTPEGRQIIRDGITRRIRGNDALTAERAELLRTVTSSLASGTTNGNILATSGDLGDVEMMTELSLGRFDVRGTTSDIVSTFKARAVQNVTADAIVHMNTRQRQEAIVQLKTVTNPRIVTDFVNTAGAAAASSNISENTRFEIQEMVANCFGSTAATAAQPRNNSTVALSTANEAARQAALNYINTVAANGSLGNNRAVYQIAHNIRTNADAIALTPNLPSTLKNEMFKIDHALAGVGVGSNPPL